MAMAGSTQSGQRKRSGPLLQNKLIDPIVVQRLIKLADFAFLSVLSLTLFIQTGARANAHHFTAAAFIAPFTAYLCLYVLRGCWLYTVRALSLPISSFAASWSVVGGLGILIYLFTNWALFSVDWTWLQYWLLGTLGYFALTRFPAATWVSSKAGEGAFRKRIAIVGSDTAAEQAIRILERTPNNSFEIIGLFDDRNDPERTVSIPGYPKIGSIADLAEHARGARIDLVIVTIPQFAEDRLLNMLKKLWELPVDVRISGHSNKLRLAPEAYTHIGDLPLLSVFNRPLGGWAAFVKAVFDRIVAAAMIVAFAPVMAATALAVRLESKGPALFKQKRYGFNNELIEVYKFRSMYTDRCDATAAKLVTKDDPRVTRVGRFIRKTSLDELPQLFNVLKGELSLVGPRPHATQAKAQDQLYEEVVEGYFGRHKIKPGITGWAQINGWRGETDTADKIENRVKYDLEYIERWSILLDLYILAMTPVSLVVNKSNAY